ncbi:MAG: hypothetical protein H5T74_11350 [Actinobacteria bacterium]|nr:hypothetical protein [Actinomycetota bacterium]
MLMPQANWIIFLHFLLLWGSVITGLASQWRIPLPLAAALPLGSMIWLLGVLYNLSTLRRHRLRPESHRTALQKRIYQRIAARTFMNLGVTVASRSWLTLMVTALLIPLYANAARRRQQYLDYLRTGMMSDAFPHRISRR